MNLNQKKIFQYTTPPINNETSANSNFIRAVYLDPSNKLWIGKHNNGLYTYNRNTGAYKKVGFGTQSIFYINAFDPNNTLVCAQGVSIVNSDGNISKIEGIDYPCFYAVRSSKDLMWIADINGVSRTQLAGSKTINTINYNSENSSPKLSINNCRVLLQDRYKNELWIGTEGGGLNILSLNKELHPTKNKIYKKIADGNSISNNYIRAIHQQSKNLFWIGTNEGLNKVVRNDKTGKLYFTHYFIQNGLPNNMIQSIIEDNEHFLWIGTNAGLVKFNPVKETMISFGISDGLQ